MARTIFSKKTLALILSILMVFNLATYSVLAEGTANGPYAVGDVVYTPDQNTLPEGEIPVQTEWEYQGSRWEVSFETGKRPEGKEHTAWYDASGGWIMTETEVFLSEVPQQIKAYLAESEYGSAQFTDNDAEYIMTPSGNYYRFDVRDGKDQFEVDVNEDGQVSLAAYGF